MTERNEYPAGVPCWVDLESPDPQGAVRFYAGLFGWEFEDPSPAVRYHVAKLRGGDVAGVGPRAAGMPAAGVWNTHIRVDSVGDVAGKVTAAGGSVVKDPYELPGVARVAVCADPAGAVFRVWEPAGRAGAQRVNEPGTWNFNELNTHDFEGSTAFYGAVFGWEASTLEFGAEVATMWRRPGYGDFLETIDPGVRRRHEEAGAPPGFTDAVGWMQQLAGDAPGGATGSGTDGGAGGAFGGAEPHWSITFAVDDADAVADRAARLGGTVEVAPYDADEYSRVAVLRDPQGARFTINRYAG